MAITLASRRRRIFETDELIIGRFLSDDAVESLKGFIDKVWNMLTKDKDDVRDTAQCNTDSSVCRDVVSTSRVQRIINQIRRRKSESSDCFHDNNMSFISYNIAHPIIQPFIILDGTLKEESSILKRFIFHLLALQQPPG